MAGENIIGTGGENSGGDNTPKISGGAEFLKHQEYKGDPDLLLKRYNDTRAELENVKKATPSPSPVNDQYKTFADENSRNAFWSKANSEYISGNLAEDTKAQLAAIGMDPARMQRFFDHVIAEDASPLKEFFPNQDFNALIKQVRTSAEPDEFGSMYDLIQKKQYKAAAAVAESVLGRVQQNKDNAPIIGQLHPNSGSGFKDYAEFEEYLQNPRYTWDKQLQAEAKAKFDATPPDVRNQWIEKQRRSR